ncbi:hypothetical protein HYH03_005312 [Edaphochlamys debaryana]|uniref:Uncharacterized protein n=1 Tax=Edaphochlamys debaryana TaxID=47281 RepID=A0A835Y4Z3_9CHLO|nr:hypothetical protein HYH03_005312 [Edaphochlamys debaryana]|eukprot:KAG2496487.1 hypothetical protein HYH03_005312 [Edaphochlamys debaryana]
MRRAGGAWAVWLSGVLGAGSGGGWPLWGVALHSQPGSRLALQGRFLSDTSACQQLLLQADVRVRSRGRLVGHLALAQEEGAREVGVEVGCRFAVRRRAAERGVAGGAALLQEALPGLGAAAAGNGGGGTVGGEQGSIGAVLRVPRAEQAPSVMLQWSVQAGMA